MKNSKLQLNSPLYGKILFNEPLCLHTSIKTGGAARLWIEPQTKEQLLNLVRLSKGLNIPLFIIGSGSNIIARDAGIDAICIKLSAPCFNETRFKKAVAEVGAGSSLAGFINEASEHSLGGFEFLTGVPGTVGGAILGNAGSKNEYIGKFIKEIEVITPNAEIKKIKGQDIKFSYRYSGLEPNIIISAKFKFNKTDKSKVKSLMRINLIKKLMSQDYKSPSAGCIFKNPDTGRISAAELIDNCALKGKTAGGAQVSMKHANFIINKHNARTKDILSLIDIVKKEVLHTHNIKLKEEVKIW